MDNIRDRQGRCVFSMGGDEYLMTMPRMEILSAYLQNVLDKANIPGSLWDNGCNYYNSNGEDGLSCYRTLQEYQEIQDAGLFSWLEHPFPVLVRERNEMTIVLSNACRSGGVVDKSRSIWDNYGDGYTDAKSPWFMKTYIQPMLVPLDKCRAWDCDRMELEMPDGTITTGGILYVENQPRSPKGKSLPFLAGDTPFWLEDTDNEDDAIEWVAINGMLMPKKALFLCYRHELRRIFGKP